MKELWWLDDEQRRMLKELDPNEKDLISELDWYKHEYFAECDRAEKLEKALDKACEVLESLSRFTPKGSTIRTKEEWKEWCLKDE